MKTISIFCKIAWGGEKIKPVTSNYAVTINVQNGVSSDKCHYIWIPMFKSEDLTTSKISFNCSLKTNDVPSLKQSLNLRFNFCLF